MFQMTGYLIGRSVPGGVLVFFLRHSVLSRVCVCVPDDWLSELKRVF